MNRSEIQDKLASSASAGSPVVPIIGGMIAIAIFVVDTATALDDAIAVLYVVVVLIAANRFQRRGVLLVASTCLALTLASYFVQHRPAADTALVRCLMSISAIGATTFLALQNQSANMVVRERARLLDLTHDTVFVRDMNDVITYWNLGAEERYGWRRDEAIGRVSHELMKTAFPMPLEDITAELHRTGRWEGELVHTKRDGTCVIVASRWSLQKNERGRPIGTMESNNDITERKRADAELRESERRFRHIFQTAGVSIWEQDFSQVKAAIDDLKTQGVKDFTVQDEFYVGLFIRPDVKPLLTSDHPEARPDRGLLGWTNEYNGTRVMYMRLGHFSSAYGNANWQKLMVNGLRWTACVRHKEFCSPSLSSKAN